MSDITFAFTTSVRPPIQLTAFVDGLHLDPPTLSFDSSSDGEVVFDFDTSDSVPAIGTGNIGSIVQAIVGGPQVKQVNLAPYPLANGVLYSRVRNGSLISNVLTSQRITVPAAFDPVNLFGVSDKGLIIDPYQTNLLYTNTGKTTNVAIDGDAVALIVDAAGKTADLSQSTSNRRPLFKTNGSQRWLLTDAISSFLVPNSFLDHSKSWTVVVGMANVSGSGTWLSDTDEGTTFFRWQSGTTKPVFQVPLAGGGAPSLVTPTNRGTDTPEIYTFQWNRSSGASSLRVNGSPVATDSDTPSDIKSRTAAYNLFSGPIPGSSQGSPTKFFYLFFIDRVLGYSDLNAIEQKAASRAGIAF